MKDLQQRLRDDETVQELEILLWEQAEKVEWQPAKAILAYVCDCLCGKVPVEEIAACINNVVAGHSVPQPYARTLAYSVGPADIVKILRDEVSRAIIRKRDKTWIG